MTRYDHIKDLSDEDFRRLTGVMPTTFEKMVEILNEKQALNRRGYRWKGGRKPALEIPDMLLVSLEYLREYRTMFHIAKSYKVGESSCWRALHFVENTLIKDGTFSLPGRKELLKSDVEYTFVVLDATEIAVERPKKSRNASIPARKKDTR